MNVNVFNEIVKNMTDVNPYNETSTLLSNNMVVTEYFYNQLPNYVFLIVSLSRLRTLNHRLKELQQINQKQGSDHNIHDSEVNDSYFFKLKLGYLMIITYVLAIGFAFLVDQFYFW